MLLIDPVAVVGRNDIIRVFGPKKRMPLCVVLGKVGVRAFGFVFVVVVVAAKKTNCLVQST